MKKTDKFLSAAVLTAAALCSSCSTDNFTAEQQGQQEPNEAKGVSLTATMDEAVTRAGMERYDGKAMFYWHKGDQILVQTTKTDGNYSGAKFYTPDDTGTGTATFWSEPLSGETIGKYAVYPYNEKHQFTNEPTLTYNLPASYKYTTVGTDIFYNTTDKTYPSNSANVPLLGTIDSENSKITFSHLGGLVVIRIDAMPYEAGTLTVSADQQLSGDFKVDLPTGNYQLTTTSTETAADKQVAFTFNGATKGSVGVFYLPVATGEYTNLTIKIADSEGTNTQTIPYGTLSMEKANVWAISLTTHDGSLRNIYSLGNGRYRINGHVFVDLGLSVLWAETNIGAEKAEDYGNYYAWGEVTAFDEQTTSGKKTNYSWSTYKWTNDNGSTFTKYTTDGKTVLDKEDDAAYVNWGSSCRMPTKAEFDELLDKTNNCNRNSTTESSVFGYKVTSRKEGYTNNSIFLPASGYRFGEDFSGQGGYGYYWSSSLYPANSSGAYYLYFFSGYPCSYNVYRCYGYAVRPVAEK